MTVSSWWTWDEPCREKVPRRPRWLTSGPAAGDEPQLDLPLPGPLDPAVHDSPIGPVRRLRWPMEAADVPFRFDRPGDPFGSSAPRWIG